MSLMKKVNDADSGILEAYGEFGRMMLADELYRDSSISFGDVCARLGVGAGELDRLVFAEMGLTGQQLMDAYRSGKAPGEYCKMI